MIPLQGHVCGTWLQPTHAFFLIDEVTLVCSGAYGANEDLVNRISEAQKNSMLLPVQATPNL
jgi:hypothetical protein